MKNQKDTILQYNPPFILGTLIASFGIVLTNIGKQYTTASYNAAETSSYLMAIAGMIFLILGIRKDLKKYSNRKKIPIVILGIILTVLLNLYTENYMISLMSLMIVFVIPYIVVKANQN